MFNPTAYEAYKHSLLEPNERLSHGNYKEHKPMRIQVMQPPAPVISEDEDNRRQDAYLEFMQTKNKTI